MDFFLTVKTFYVDNLIACIKEEIGKEDGLYKIATGIVPQIENKMLHSLNQQKISRFNNLFDSGRIELGKFQIAGSIVHHVGNIHTMHRNRSPSNVKIQNLLIPQDLNGYMRIQFSLHTEDHAVLRTSDTGYHFSIHLDDAVATHHPHFLSRASGNDIRDDSRIIRHIEHDADSIEFAGQFAVRPFQVHRWKVYRMRVECTQYRLYCDISQLLDINCIHIIIFNLSQDKIEFLPFFIIRSDQPLVLETDETVDRYSQEHAQDNAQDCNQQ